MNKEKLYIWACDLSQYTGEGNLGNLFLKKKITPFYNLKIIRPKNKLFLKNPFFKHKYITPILGIFYCWKFYFLKRKICYLNYLPLWNILIFIFLPPSSVLGPITGGSNYKKEFSINYFVREYFFPVLYKISIFILKLRNFKTIFATNLLRNYINNSIKLNSEFNFILEGLKKKIKLKRIVTYDFIVYYRKHKNKKKLYPIEFIKKLIELKFKIIVVGDNLNLSGVKNLGFINKKKLQNVLLNTKIFISSGENIYNFFTIDCINCNVKIISSYRPIKVGKKFDKNIIHFNTQKKFKKKDITKLLE